MICKINSKINKIYFGGVSIAKVYKGNKLCFQTNNGSGEVEPSNPYEGKVYVRIVKSNNNYTDSSLEHLSFQNASGTTVAPIGYQVKDDGGYYYFDEDIKTLTPTSTTKEVVGQSAYITLIQLPNCITTLGQKAFYGYILTNLKTLILGSGLTTLGDSAIYHMDKLEVIKCYADIQPTLGATPFLEIKEGGTLYYPKGSNYSKWLSSDWHSYCLGEYGWTGVEMAAKTAISTTKSIYEVSTAEVDSDATSATLKITIANLTKWDNGAESTEYTYDNVTVNFDINTSNKEVVRTGSGTYDGMPYTWTVTQLGKNTTIITYKGGGVNILKDASLHKSLLIYYGNYIEKVQIGSNVKEIDSDFLNGELIQKDNFINYSILDASAYDYWGCRLYDTMTDDGIAITDNTVIDVRWQKHEQNISIPEGVTEIKYLNNDLTYGTIYIPNSVTKFSKNIFGEGDVNIVINEVKYNGNAAQWTAIENHNELEKRSVYGDGGIWLVIRKMTYLK